VTKSTDISVVGTRLYFIPIQMRMPLKFGPETVTSVTCARVRVTVADRTGRRAEGWGETPLSVQWVWPSKLPYETRHQALKTFCAQLAEAWVGFGEFGHPIEIGYAFQEQLLPVLRSRVSTADPQMPWLGALVCCSPFDIAVHDAYGQLHGRRVYDTYNRHWMSRDLACYFGDESSGFGGQFPDNYMASAPATQLRAWHLVGGLDPLTKSDLNGAEPNDGYPVVLTDWIARDGLTCLKVKLRGNDAAWDYERLVRVGEIALANGVEWLSADFNCTVTDPEYVNAMLDRLRNEQPRIFAMILYVEQPFPYELEEHPIKVHSVSARKPLFLDESAHDWKMIGLGRELGWNGVALKTCKTQTGAILSACWARAHDMALMVQDLTNPMLAQVPHVLLAAHVGTIMGVETNAMQFYPEASKAEAKVHPGIYKRTAGHLDLSTIRGSGFGYAGAEHVRELGSAAVSFQR
jgi:L-alanine-DL-glutamate epimerase-like enolase superfamily enzyme